MKKILKLTLTSVFLGIGALVSFGAQNDAMGNRAMMNDTDSANRRGAMREMKDKLSDADFRELVGSKTVDQLIDRIRERVKSNEQLKDFINHVKAEKPAQVAALKKFLDNNKGPFNEKQKAEFKKLLSDIFPAIQNLKEKMGEVKAKAKERMAERKEAMRSGAY